jgi:hypothetical protein
MRLKIWALGGALLLAVAGCGGTGKAGAGGSPTTVADPVPAVITVSYINHVLAQLNVVYSDALRISLTTKQITPQVKTDLRAIYADPLYQEEINGFELQLKHYPSDLRPHIGNRITTVVKLISASPKCIFITTQENFSQIVAHPGRGFGSEYYSLVRKASKDDPDHLNRTPWQFGYNFASIKPHLVADQC